MAGILLSVKIDGAVGNRFGGFPGSVCLDCSVELGMASGEDEFDEEGLPNFGLWAAAAGESL